MFFTKVGTWVASIGFVFAAFNIVTVVTLSVLGGPASEEILRDIGTNLDFAIYTAFSCSVLGVLCEISKHLSNSQATTADSSKTD